MVLETLYGLLKPEKHPLTLAVLAFIITTAAMLISYNNFPESTSVLTILFITLGFMPIIHNIFVNEEKREVDEADVPFAFIATHFGVVRSYSWIFIGMVIAFSFWSIALPAAVEAEKCSGSLCLPPKELVFSEQKKVYSAITGKATANVIGEGVCFGNGRSFERCFFLIFNNNFGVMARAILFSFIWGAGAIELLGWNASVIGFFIGSEITEKSFDAGLARAVSYLPHGVPEILSYFIAAIAGGIIHAAVSKSTFRKNELKVVFVDVVLLMLLSTIILVIGAIIETSSIFGYWEAAIAGVIAFFALLLFLYVPAIRYKINKVREYHIGE